VTAAGGWEREREVERSNAAGRVDKVI